MGSVFDFTCTTIIGEEKAMSEFRGNVILVVNTASKCGLTPQFKGMEQLWHKYREQGLMVLGFPCNQFGNQDPGSNDEISTFCELNYGVSFPMYAKIDVNGKNTAPLFRYLKEQARGLMGSKGIKWNFTKFLVDREGNVVSRFSPKTTPSDLENEIENLL